MNIHSIIFGYNKNDLYGSVNDAILIYNLFYRFYLNYKNWNIPKLYLDTDVNFLNIINDSQSISKNDLLLIYFSGHSSKDGYLHFYNKKISCNTILEELNKEKVYNIYFIIDSCFSKKFIISNYKNYKILKYIVSSYENETSKEIIVSYDKKMFPYKNIKIINNNLVIGIFTLYFYKLINVKNLYNINDWKNEVVNNPLWNIIKEKYGQRINYSENTD